MYAKIGRNISKWLLYGGIGATLCYVIAALSPIPIAALIACAATGFFVAMMWPGILVVAEKFIPMGGVFIFAMMASGGDLGASVGPQLVGLVTDFIIAIPSAATLSAAIGITSEQLGMKVGAIMWCVRIAVSGMAATPGGATEIMEVIGKEASLARINTALAKL